MNITELEIRSFLKEYLDAINSRVFSNLADKIHPDALYRGGEGDFKNVDNIRDAFESSWDGASIGENYSLMDVRIVYSDSKSAVVAYSFTWSGIEDGKSFLITGRGTNVIVTDGRKLQCICEHISR